MTDRGDVVSDCDCDLSSSLTCLTALDSNVLTGRNKNRRFDLSIVYAVARRCRYKHPQVLLCRPFSEEGPFPTTFWLTCPYLEKRCAELESEQQIALLEEILASRQEETDKWHKAYAQLRKKTLDAGVASQPSEKEIVLPHSVLDKGAGGIDNVKNPSAAKCLHMQVAAWMGMGWHPASDWLAERLDSLDDCGGEYCQRFTK